MVAVIMVAAQRAIIAPVARVVVMIVITCHDGSNGKHGVFTRCTEGYSSQIR